VDQARSAGDFPEGETRLVNFRNPVTTPWDGQTGDIPCWVRHISGNDFQVFAINCAHLGCPVRWFAQSKLFCAPATAALTTKMDRARQVRRSGACFVYDHKIVAGSLMISAGKMPTLAARNCSQAKAHADSASPTASASFEEPKPTVKIPRQGIAHGQPEAARIDVYNWFEQRLGLGAPAIEAAEHEVPSNTSSWWYVFGSAATVILVLQV
jgi:hypothetical protein